jgi:Rrf2 family protein
MEEGYISLKDIAARQGVSMKYLELIIPALHKAGYVKSTRGKFGGYKLAKPAGECTVGAILKLTEGSMAPVSCLDCEDSCSRAADCITLPMWMKLDQIIDEYLESVTIEDLILNKIDSYTI